jgi:DNA-binding LacI/PurR family transcriptional regulator
MNNKTSKKYNMVYELILKKIRQNCYTNELLPPEDELCEEYQVSRNTVRQALKLLSDNGVIDKCRGRQTHICGKGDRPAKKLQLVFAHEEPNLENPIYLKIFNAIKADADACGHKLNHVAALGVKTPEEAAKAATVIRAADGVFGSYLPESKLLPEILQALRDNGQVIGVDYVLGQFGIQFVATDNYLGGRMAAQHLVNSGCRKMAVIGCNSSLFRYSAFLERGMGFADVQRELQLPFGKDQAFFSEDFKDLYNVRPVLEELLKRHEDIDGIFALTDHLAINIVYALEAMGIKVPQDISVIGFDGIDYSYFGGHGVNLTTIRQEVEAIGHTAFKLMQERILEKRSEFGIFKIPPRLIIGDTTRK